MAGFTVGQLYADRKDYLELTLLTNGEGLKKEISTSEIQRPGLALAGYTKRFAHHRVQVLGETEFSFLRNRGLTWTRETAERIFSLDLPCLFITKSLRPPEVLIEVANQMKTAVLGSRLTTTEFIHRLAPYLDHLFAPSTTIHGTLVDVYGVGLLYRGRSGIGKSETALDLVERGHRLVADDVIKVTRRAPEVIVGAGSKLLRHHMEIRGIGIIDVEHLFGIRAIRIQKRIEVEVHLVLWDDRAEYDRLGLDETYTTILGVEIPKVTIPLSPGKNITVISEVIAMNHMLKVYGESPAKKFNRRLLEEIRRKKSTGEYLESDYE